MTAAIAVLQLVLLVTTPAPVGRQPAKPFAAPIAQAPCATLPPMPRSLRATLSDSQVLVSWDAPLLPSCAGVTQYIVIRSTGSPVIVDSPATSAWLPADPGLRVAVAASNAVGCSLRTGWVTPAPIRSASLR